MSVKRESSRYFKLCNAWRLDVPKDLIPFLGTIRTGAEWESLGFNPYDRVTRSGNSETHQSGGFERGGLHFGFDAQLRGHDTGWHLAITSQKKLIDNPDEAWIYRELGVDYAEISNITKDVVAYAEANLALNNGDAALASEYIKIAMELKPKELRYIVFSFKSRLLAKDASVIPDEMNFFKNDMDAMVHSGRAEEWIKLSIEMGQYTLVADIAIRVIRGLELLISGQAGKGIYGSQQVSWYEYKMKQFIQRLGSIKGFVSDDLVLQNTHKKEEIIRLIEQIANHVPKKSHKLIKLLTLADGAGQATYRNRA